MKLAMSLGKQEIWLGSRFHAKTSSSAAGLSTADFIPILSCG